MKKEVETLKEDIIKKGKRKGDVKFILITRVHGKSSSFHCEKIQKEEKLENSKRSEDGEQILPYENKLI